MNPSAFFSEPPAGLASIGLPHGLNNPNESIGFAHRYQASKEGHANSSSSCLCAIHPFIQCPHNLISFAGLAGMVCNLAHLLAPAVRNRHSQFNSMSNPFIPTNRNQSNPSHRVCLVVCIL